MATNEQYNNTHAPIDACNVSKHKKGHTATLTARIVRCMPCYGNMVICLPTLRKNSVWHRVFFRRAEGLGG
jgi:hypothetical protein